MLIRRLLACLGVMLSVALAAAAPVQLAPRTADEWIASLETPARVQSLKIPEVLRKLALKPGMIVADIGAGTGVFSLEFSRSIKPGGKVYAVEVDEKLIDHITSSATEQGIVNLEGVYGDYDDPSLPTEIDFAFLNDVLHHIAHRDVYLKNLAGYLKPGGRVAVIDFKPGQGDHANDPALQVGLEQTTAWMTAAGLKPLETIQDLFPDRWFVIYGK